MRATLALGLCLSFAASSSLSNPRYPAAKKEDAIIWKHGVRIYDPYVWMENDHDPDLQKWVKAQNQYVDEQLASPIREQLISEFEKMYSGKNASDSTSLLDVNVIQDQRHFWYHRVTPFGGFAHKSVSDNGTFEIILESESGSDLKALRIKNSETNSYLPDLLHVKFSDFFWDKEGQSFIYTSDRDARLGGTHPVIRRHILGTKQNQDSVLFEAPDFDTWLGLTKIDDRYLLTLENRKYVKRGLFNPQNGELSNTWHQGTTTVIDFAFDEDHLFQISFEDADKGEIIRRNILTGQKKRLIGATDLVIDSAYRKGNVYYVIYIDNAAHRLFVYDLNHSSNGKEIQLPGNGSITIIPTDDKIKFTYESYSEKSSLWVLKEDSQTLELEVPAEALPVSLAARRVYYKAHNGKQTPIWLVHKSGLELDQDTPIYMYGYGGFGINILPRINPSYLPWYQRGGVVAFVTLPGGLEFGRTWMESGQLNNKKNVFDDFARAGSHLIDLGVTSRSNLAIGGGSNGGLLVGATANLYPNLFAAAVPEVGVMDLINFQRFTGGKWWQADYGNREQPQEFINQFRLSPYHQIRSIAYPAMLVIPADFDDRVVPSHAYRYAARLQELNQSSRPIYLHTRLGSSHGFTGTTDERVRYEANKWTFLIQHLGVK